MIDLSRYIYPSSCLYCGEKLDTGERVCADCMDKLPVILGETCSRCGLEIGDCNCKVGDFAFVSNIAPYRYDGPVKSIVKRMKFGKLPQLLKPMSDDMLSVFNRRYGEIEFDAVSYVPMSTLARLERGFNQSEILAHKLSSSLGVPLRSTLKKKFGVRPQKKMKTITQRRKNVNNKFYTIADVKGQTILLVDDVSTTGSTLSECAKTLKRAGAEQVFCITYAITCKK